MTDQGTPVGGEQRIAELERKLAIVIWLHAELAYTLKVAALKAAAQQRSNLQKQVMSRLMGANA